MDMGGHSKAARGHTMKSCTVESNVWAGLGGNRLERELGHGPPSLQRVSIWPWEASTRQRALSRRRWGIKIGSVYGHGEPVNISEGSA